MQLHNDGTSLKQNVAEAGVKTITLCQIPEAAKQHHPLLSYPVISSI
jgi:hypothetical protein